METPLNATISAANLQAIKDAITTINNNLPFLIGLDPDQYKKLAKMEEARYPFVQDAIRLSKNNSQLESQFNTFGDLNTSYELCQALDEISGSIATLSIKVLHTRAYAGNQAYKAGLEIYDTSKRGTKYGVPGMAAVYNELKKYFARKSKPKPI